jgi:hypothetical protein
MNAMRLSTAIVLLIWQVGKLWQLRERRRSNQRRREFWDRMDAFNDRHEKNMEAIRSGMPVPYPNNSVDWPRGESST